DTGFELDGWTALVREVVRRHGDRLASVQITNEPNLSFMDGSKPYVLDALVDGVLAAKDEVRRLGLTIDVGVGSVPQSDVALPACGGGPGRGGGPAFGRACAFVGHHFLRRRFQTAGRARDHPGTGRAGAARSARAGARHRRHPADDPDPGRRERLADGYRSV